MAKEGPDPEKMEAEQWLADYLGIPVQNVRQMSDEELTIAIVGDLE